MFHSDEKRHYKRFLVSGLARVRVHPGNFSDEESEIVNFGRGGTLILSDAPLPPDTELEIRFKIQGFNRELNAKGRVVRHAPGAMAVEFFVGPQDFEDLMGWLEAGLVATFLKS